MSEPTFRNRRGNRISIREAVTGIESQDASPLREASTNERPLKKKITSSQKQSRASKKRRSFKFPKKILFIILAALLLAVLTGIMVVDGVKRDYERQASTLRRDVTDITKAPSSRETSAVAVTDNLLASLDRPSTCSVSLDVAPWYPPAAEAKQTCESIAAQYDELKQHIVEMRDMAIYASSLDKALGGALQNPNSGMYASVVEYSGRWEASTDQLRQLTTPDGLEDEHSTLVKRANKIHETWQLLSQANTDQNQAGFMQAEKQLAADYIAIRDSYQAIAQSIDRKQQGIDTLVQTLTIQEN